jgi:RNA polymerase sigma factor (sigma-70 family)
MSDVTRILAQIDQGDPTAASQLLPLVYDELRKLAASRLAHEQPGQTLQATALVHEAYLRLVQPASGGREAPGQSAPTPDSRSPTPDSHSQTSDLRPLTSPASFSSRGHFFAAAAEAMRRILIDRARQKATLKKGGHLDRVPLNDLAANDITDHELLALDDALQKLIQTDPQAAQLVKLRYFAGLSMDAAAEALGISPRTAYYTWDYARSFLRQELRS